MNKDLLVQVSVLTERCIEEAIGWCIEAKGCEPQDLLGYDGWIEDARNFLKDIEKEMK